MLLFGYAGITFLMAGIFVGFYLFTKYLADKLNPTRPLMYLMVVLIIMGIQMLAFGFLGLKMVFLRKEQVKEHFTIRI